MRVAALVLIAIIGFVNGQGQTNPHMADRGFSYGQKPGGGSGSMRHGNQHNQGLDNGYQGMGNNGQGVGGGYNGFGNPARQTNMQGHGNGVNHQNAGTAPNAGGSSRGINYNGGYNGFGNYPARQTNMQGHGNGVNHQNAGNAPNAGGSSRGINYDYPQYMNNQGATNQLDHVNAGAQPQAGGSSNGMGEVPLGPVQTGMTNQVNMQNAGTPPEQGNSPNSGEYVDNYNWGAPVGGVAANGATGDMQPANPAAPLGGQETFVGQGAGGSSTNNGQYVAPLGGAQISDFTQKEAGKPAHSTGGASVGGATAGVVIAVLVLVGIVGVAAVFLIKQRRSRMSLSQV